VSSVKPEKRADELDGCEERAGEFVIARGNCTEPFEFAKESFDEIAFAIEREVGITLDDTVGFGRDDGLDPSSLQGLDQGIGIICLIGKKGLWFDLLEQWCGLAEIGLLTRRE